MTALRLFINMLRPLLLQRQFGRCVRTPLWAVCAFSPAGTGARARVHAIGADPEAGSMLEVLREATRSLRQ
jgi:hypothetical protein